MASRPALSVDVINDVCNGVALVYEKLASNELLWQFLKRCQFVVRFEPTECSVFIVACVGELACRAIEKPLDDDVDRHGICRVMTWHD